MPAPSSAKPGVSILRPLKGLDPNLYENLRSAFEQDYPDIEIIFSVADDKDPALRVVNELIDRFGADTTNDGRRRTVRVVTGELDRLSSLVLSGALGGHEASHILRAATSKGAINEADGRACEGESSLPPSRELELKLTGGREG